MGNLELNTNYSDEPVERISVLMKSKEDIQQQMKTF
jgi:hypothetical protein